MPVVDKELKRRLATAFRLLNPVAATSLPESSSLNDRLERIITASGALPSVGVEPAVARMFATAAVDIWLRAVHSFLISASLTDASPIWASVSGYYSSYYSVRAVAHILGYFHMYRRKRLVRLELGDSGHVCIFDAKAASDREHRLYWRLVRHHPHFASDAFFTDSAPGSDVSEVGHRNFANYTDHLYPYPKFVALDEESTRRHIQKISTIAVVTPPIPNRSRFPDVAAVQLLAYHRVIRFRQFLDEAVGGDNRFWKVHRTPTWAESVMDFQIIGRGGERSIPAST